MVTKIWVIIGPGNGLLPDESKPLPEPMFSLVSKWVIKFNGLSGDIVLISEVQ